MGFRQGLLFIVYFISVASLSFSQNAKQKLDPKLSFGKFRSDTINIAKANDIVIADSIFIGEKNMAGGRIVSFDLFTKLDSVSVIENTYGNRLSKKQIMLIRLASSGQMIYLQNILVKYPGKDKAKLNARFAFKIKK